MDEVTVRERGGAAAVGKDATEFLLGREGGGLEGIIGTAFC
jgi:hypothetical protein